MTTPAPPLTEAELDSMSNMRANLWPFGWVNRVIAQARRALALESELAQLRRELDALRAFEDQARNALENGRWEGPAISDGLLLLKAIDEARK